MQLKDFVVGSKVNGLEVNSIQFGTIGKEPTYTYTDNGDGVQNRDELYLPEEQTVDADTGEVIETEATQNAAD